MKRVTLLCALFCALAAAGQEKPAPEPTPAELKLENAQLRLQLAQIKEQLLTVQYQMVQMEKQQAQAAVKAEEAKKPVPPKK